MSEKLRKWSQNAFLLAAIAAVCGGSVPVAAKVALEVFQPFTVVTLRFFFASLFLLPFVYRSRELNSSFFTSFFKVALIGSLNPILLFIALPFTKASVSPLIYACVPALTAIYLYFAQNKTISKKQIMGIIIGFIGVALIILLPLLQKGNDPSAFIGNVLIFGAAIAFMYYGIISKKEQNNVGASPLALTFYFSLVTLLISLPFTARELLMNDLTQQVGIQHILSGVVVGVIGTGIFYLSYQYALKVGSEVAASLFTYLQPIATIILAALFLSERITIPFLIGGVLAVFGARIASIKT